jgi:uncharacterized protein
MSEEIAQEALRIALESPSPHIKIEFQGGEPLLNLSLIQKIVGEASAARHRVGKRIDFVIASNLALLTDEVLKFCKANEVLLSTSLDGPAHLHNKNRPRPGNDSYQLAVAGIKKAREALGSDRVSALMTTTEASLERVEEIIDEYIALDFSGIFLRPLSPYGFAVKTKAFQKYDAQRWLDFYKRGLHYILGINRRGIHFREFYASVLLQRLLTDRPSGFVDLRSPAGIGLGALVYNYDGKVFASDEGRMLAEMGDSTFELGQVFGATYRSLILSDKLVALVSESLTQCAPECADCVYEPHCGADPVYHHATQHDTLGIKPLSEFCARQKGLMGELLSIMEGFTAGRSHPPRLGSELMLALHGHASSVRGFEGIDRSCVLRLRSPHDTPRLAADAALVGSGVELRKAAQNGFGVAVMVADKTCTPLGAEDVVPRSITLPTEFAYLEAGDIIALRSVSGRIRTLFRKRSRHNAFLVTERCNHYCLMCSQPPRNVDDHWLLDEIRSCLPLIDPDIRSLEPLLDWEQFIGIIASCKDHLPRTAIQVLSNGRAFADTKVVAAWANVQHPNVRVAIPIYAAVDHIHDYVVQAVGAFDETVLGILKLKDKSQRVEVRVVLHAVTAPRIVETCTWLARNLPFVDHVALMGLENTGFAIANAEELWIDPMDYQERLAMGVRILASAGVHVSIYNIPLCLLPRSVWAHSVQSISDWKNAYVDECDHCIEKSRCAGFFTTGRPRFSRGIAAITAN